LVITSKYRGSRKCGLPTNLPQTESMLVVMSCQLHVGCATIAAC